MAQRTTETHRLIKSKDWNAVNKRLATVEGKTEATVEDEEGRLIFHLDELYDIEVPLQTLQAAHDANGTGFVAKYDSVESERITYPIFLAVRNTRLQVISFLLQLHPESAKQKTDLNWLPLHAACDNGNDEAVRLLLSVYPAAAAMEDDNHFYPILLSQDCSFESQLQLLSAFPAIANEKYRFETGNTLLHYAAQFFKDYRTIESILYLNRNAVMVRNDENDLPIHIGLTNKSVLSVELLNLLTHGNNYDAMAQKGSGGMLPLHMLCCYNWVDDRNTKVINVFREVLRRYSNAAHEMAKDSSLPLDCLLENAKNLKQGITPAFVEIWCSLVAIAPQSLQGGSRDLSPFVKLSLDTIPPKELWTNAAIYFPTALCSVEYARSALSYALSQKGNTEDVLDSSSLSYFILRETFRCLRHVHYHDDLAHGVIEEDIPAIHMLMYCYHLLDSDSFDLHYYYYFYEMDEEQEKLWRQQDSKGNTLLHTMCRAPSPNKQTIIYDGKSFSCNLRYLSSNYVSSAGHLAPIKNGLGDLPIHFLLRNRRPIIYKFNDAVDELMTGNKSAALVADSQEHLYPFMLAALNVAQRKELDVCSLTYTMLQDFVASADLTTYFCSAPSTSLRPQKRLDSECERVEQDSIPKKRRV